ncbi:hypothetical protein Taro_029271, partial [Colocasia esculenta]|nr:hypothetical protein [Colocasia esculenta]
MASRGRHGGVPAREDEPRREERAEQQAPTPQGLVLPPLPPVDYGVFMQGLVQAMQTQAHTQATLQAQLEAQAQVPAQDHGGPSIMERFKRMLIEKIFRAIRCADEDKVTLATYMLQVSQTMTLHTPMGQDPSLAGFWMHCTASGQDLDAKALLASTPWTPTTVGGHPLDANPILAARP